MSAPNKQTESSIPSHQKGFFMRLLLLGGAIMLLSQIVISWFALDRFEQALSPQLNQKAVAVGTALSSQIAYASQELGIPINELVGVNDFFQSAIETNPDLQYLTIVNHDVGILFQHNAPEDVIQSLMGELKQPFGSKGSHFTEEIAGYLDSRFPIYVEDNPVAHLHVGVSSENVRRQLFTIVFEIISVILVSMVVTIEILNLYMSRNILVPTGLVHRVFESGAKGQFTPRLAMRARNEFGIMVSSLNRLLYELEQRYQDFQFELRELRDAQIDPRVSKKISSIISMTSKRFGFSDQFSTLEKSATQIRMPFFLFIFSEEMSRSFFPLFVIGFIPIEPALSYELMISLPITLFMVATFLATLAAGKWTYRMGCSRLFLLGIVFAFVGYFGTFFAGSYAELILWRCLNGIGYGLIFNACETWIALYSKESNRAHGASAYVGAIFAGYICGPSLGGMLAEYLGQDTTFLISAGLAMISGYAAYRLLASSSPPGKAESKQESSSIKQTGFQPWKTLFTHPRFVGLVFTAVATRTTLSAFLFFLIPLYLNELGHSTTEIGQMMMLYGGIIVIGTPGISGFCDRIKRYFPMTFVGALISGIGLLFILTSGMIGESRAVLISIIAVGLGHCLILSPQYAMMQQIVYEHREQIESSVSISIYRFVDRIGLIIGPVLAALLIQRTSYPNSIATIGAIVLISMLCSVTFYNKQRDRIKSALKASSL
ncbi:MAG: MFS transporter [Gammaproteobacteria bacterium]|nr:MFS transporter [Gammaproteobacteria bacterium]MCY4218348.1 MFS transporter [Gammaproteobacteria bacterium]